MFSFDQGRVPYPELSFDCSWPSSWNCLHSTPPHQPSWYFFLSPSLSFPPSLSLPYTQAPGTSSAWKHSFFNPISWSDGDWASWHRKTDTVLYLSPLCCHWLSRGTKPGPLDSSPLISLCIIPAFSKKRPAILNARVCRFIVQSPMELHEEASLRMRLKNTILMQQSS